MKKVIVGLLIVTMALAFGNKWTNSKLKYFPKHFPEPLYTLDTSALGLLQIELGRALFYDPILSKDSTISCASCHSPYNAFAHTDHRLSHGIYDSIGTRNAPALFNLAWQKSFMWDGAINHIEVQALAPITHPGEMAETLENVLFKLNHNKFYQNKFLHAFGQKEINTKNMLKALTQFQLSLVSATSKYDKVLLGNQSFTEQEQKGYEIFKEYCSSCHQEPLFSSNQYKNNGLPVDSILYDKGRATVTLKTKDQFLFKVPSLRNLSYTYPYMHDGRFDKLYDVLAHYTNHQGQTNSSPELNLPIKLTSSERTELISFLLTLNDKPFIFNPTNKFPRHLLLHKQ